MCRHWRSSDLWFPIIRNPHPGCSFRRSASSCLPRIIPSSAKGSDIMTSIIRALLAFAVGLFQSRVSLQLEILALQHQLSVYRRSIRRPRVRPPARLVWAWLSRGWSRWREVLVFVQPETVLAWQRQRFREHWAGLSRRAPGRPAIPNQLFSLLPWLADTSGAGHGLPGTPPRLTARTGSGGRFSGSRGAPSSL